MSDLSVFNIQLSYKRVNVAKPLKNRVDCHRTHQVLLYHATWEHDMRKRAKIEILARQ